MLNAVVDALLPPASLAVLAFLLLLGTRRRIWALAILAILNALSVPVLASALVGSLAPPAGPAGPAPDAIVILSADGVRVAGPDQLEPGLLTLDRLRAGAALARRTHLPILVSGGIVLGQPIPLADMMARSLEQDFGVDALWRENQSRDTWENAKFSAAILKQAGISRIYLVTHFWHMRRALIAFRHFGLDVTPAPVTPALPVPFELLYLIPRTFGWEESYLAVHEWIGVAYYSIRR